MEKVFKESYNILSFIFIKFHVCRLQNSHAVKLKLLWWSEVKTDSLTLWRQRLWQKYSMGWHYITSVPNDLARENMSRERKSRMSRRQEEQLSVTSLSGAAEGCAATQDWWVFQQRPQVKSRLPKRCHRILRETVQIRVRSSTGECPSRQWRAD